MFFNDVHILRSASAIPLGICTHHDWQLEVKIAQGRILIRAYVRVGPHRHRTGVSIDIAF